MSGTAVSRGITPILTAIPGLSGTYGFPQVTINAGGQITSIVSLTTYTGNLSFTGKVVMAPTQGIALSLIANGTFNALGITGGNSTSPVVIAGTNTLGYQIAFQGTSALQGCVGIGPITVTGISSNSLGLASVGGNVVLGGNQGSIQVAVTCSNTTQPGITFTTTPTSQVPVVLVQAGTGANGASNGLWIYAGTGSSDVAFVINDNLNAVNRVVVLGNGNTTFYNQVGINGASPPAKLTGWGTPTGAAVVSNFPSSATLAQCGTAIAEIITALKNFGLFGA